MKKGLLVCMALCLMFLLAGCSSDNNAATEATAAPVETEAPEETEAPAEETEAAEDAADGDAVLNIFTWEGYIDYETVIKPFEEETGIKVNYATFASNEEMYEKLSAVNGGDYDIILASDYILNTTREAGLMQKFDPEIVTNYGNLNEDFTHQFFDPDNEYVIPYVSGIPLIVYDPSVVDIEIKGFNDLWDSSLADSLGLIDDARVTIGMVLLSMGQSMNTTDEAVLAEAAEKLEELRPNIHVLEYENLHNYLVSGDVSVAYTFTPFVALALDANPDLQVVWPQEGLGFGIDGCFIPVNAPHAKNANLFLEYLLRPEVAAVCAEWQYYCSPNEAAQDVLADWYKENPVFSGIYERIDDAEYVLNLSSEDEQKFQDIWTKFKLGF
ncbi:MAG: spermidine/putrescine ABC transporter substrate-binding protein [Clostridia bacterium]|nr:spermidine/putrescine ABC transporter substrate-binding protein [Clostridia bacterium]